MASTSVSQDTLESRFSEPRFTFASFSSESDLMEVRSNKASDIVTVNGMEYRKPSKALREKGATQRSKGRKWYVFRLTIAIPSPSTPDVGL